LTKSDVVRWSYANVHEFIDIKQLISIRSIFSTKFDSRFSNLLETKRTKFYSDLFTFDIFIVQCLWVYFLLDTLQCTTSRLK